MMRNTQKNNIYQDTEEPSKFMQKLTELRIQKLLIEKYCLPPLTLILKEMLLEIS